MYSKNKINNWNQKVEMHFSISAKVYPHSQMTFDKVHFFLIYENTNVQTLAQTSKWLPSTSHRVKEETPWV